MTRLPPFQLLDAGPQPPHRRRVLARHTNAKGIVFELSENWPRTAWWLTATKDGLRKAEGMRTASARVAREWQKDVEQGQVEIG